MLLDQPGDGLGFGFAEPQARAQFERDLRTQFGMIPAPAFRNVVDEDGQVKHPSGQHLVNDLHRQGVILGEAAVFNLGQNSDRLDGVLVDGIDVIHVVLHLRHHTTELGQELTQNTGFIHAAQGNVGGFWRGQHFNE